MTLNGEWEKAKKQWKEASILARIFIAINIFLAASSVTSLSGTIIAWRGFILDGIEFYYRHVVFPVTRIAFELGLSPTYVNVDWVVLFSLILAAFIRLQVLVARENKQLRKRAIIEISAAILTLPIMTFSIFLYDLNLGANIESLPTIANYAAITGAFLYANFQIARQGMKHLVFMAYLPIFTGVLCVFILAAINSGLAGLVA